MTLLDAQPLAVAKALGEARLAARQIDGALERCEFVAHENHDTSMLVGLSTRTLVRPSNKQAGILLMMETIGQRVRAVRLEKKLSQAKLGKAVGVTQQAIAQLESGDTRETVLVARIAKELGVSAYWLDTGMGPKEDIDGADLSDEDRSIIDDLNVLKKEDPASWRIYLDGLRAQARAARERRQQES